MNSIQIILPILYNMVSTVLTYLYLFLTLGAPTKPRKYVYFVCLVYYFAISLVVLLCSELFRPFILFGTNIVTMYFITTAFEGSWKKKALAIIIAYTFLALSESVSNLLITLLPYWDNKPALQYTVRLLSGKTIAFIILIILLRIRRVKVFDYYEINTITWVKLSVVPVLSIGFLIIYAHNIDEIDIFYLFLVALLIAINVVFFSLYKENALNYSKMLELKKMEIQNTYYSHYLQEIVKNQRQFRVFKHNYKNSLITLNLYLKQKNITKAMQYLDELGSYSGLSNPTVNSGNTELDAVLNYLISKAQSLNIQCEWNILVPATVFVSPFDVTIILGNLFDNAIEAAQLCEDNNRHVNVTLKYSINDLFLKIENTTKNADFERTVVNSKSLLHTTKMDGNNHGIGLSSVLQIISKYNGIMEIESTCGIFAINVLLIAP